MKSKTSRICRWTESTESFFYVLLSLVKPVLYACWVCLRCRLPCLRNWTRTRVLKYTVYKGKRKQKAEGRQMSPCFGTSWHLYPVWEREQGAENGKRCKVSWSLFHLSSERCWKVDSGSLFAKEWAPRADETGTRAEYWFGECIEQAEERWREENTEDHEKDEQRDMSRKES